MNLPRWRIIDLFLLTLLVGLAAGVYVAFWSPNAAWDSPNHQIILLTAFATLLSTSTLGAFLGRLSIRRFCMGYAACNWLLLTLMYFFGSFYMIGNGYAISMIAGPAAGAVAGILSHWILRPLGKET